MDTKSKFLSKISLALLIGLGIGFIYVVYRAMVVVDKRSIGTNTGIYTNKVKITKITKAKATVLTKGCTSEVCKVQSILDYVSNIPYKINRSYASFPDKTMQQNYGDCDDKSNLLISLLSVLGFESYFVLVPQHIFVITHLKQDLAKKAFILNHKKYYILESTAKNSQVGYPLGYKLSEIDAIVEPFQNKRIEVKSILYK